MSAPTLCPFAKLELLDTNEGGQMSENIGLVVHEAEGDGDLYGWFNNPSAQVSAHFWVGKDGTLCQYVPTNLVAWAEMNGNGSYLSVETEGFATEAFTDAQIATLARLIAWGCQNFGWPMQLVDHGGSGITTHCHYPSGQPDPAYGNHPCPGLIRLGQMPAVLAAAQALTSPAPPAPTLEDYMQCEVVSSTNPQTGKSAEFVIRAQDVLWIPDGTIASIAWASRSNTGDSTPPAKAAEWILFWNGSKWPVGAP